MGFFIGMLNGGFMYMATSSGITSNPYEFISQVCSSLDDMWV
ncbi:hypothetical protein BMWSH_1946 [Priestia megaterium WSH-002]|uniref:Uncharacterized protein n=1 Tax=Priestia megaterium (strain WSH-002) TaxID=1006007 RepID=A0A8D3WY83_PRIMW|nr:hypothetical protein BMWSH_1946 [Priestia megaterium WSH-002]